MKEKAVFWFVGLFTTALSSFSIVYDPKEILIELYKAKMNEQATIIINAYESILMMETINTFFYVFICLLLFFNISIQLLNYYDRIKATFNLLLKFVKKLKPKLKAWFKSILIKIKNLTKR